MCRALTTIKMGYGLRRCHKDGKFVLRSLLQDRHGLLTEDSSKTSLSQEFMHR
jgi:hypothetical protein